MTKLSFPSIDSETTECTILNCDGICAPIETRSINDKDLLADTIDDKISAMTCVGCGGNIDPQTLSCKCCGRQYRLVASDEKS